ncbi:MAG: leucine-rich repeat domain-containing protein, partial [Bacteroidales bacterium]|nr:leucine-rich repeat domain-containing protein [Bacteroidales bacterium]
MKKLLLFIAILISGMGLFAQNIGDNRIIDYDGYSLKYVVTSLEPAECEVVCSNYPTTPTAITIPSTVEIEGVEFVVTEIAENAFYQCYKLTSIEIPNSIDSIQYRAFYKCNNLNSIYIPSSLIYIRNGSDAFFNCANLTSIVVDEENPVFDSRDNCNAIIETATNTLVVGCKGSTIPNSVESIGGFAFDNCGFIGELKIPHSVRRIESCAFQRCGISGTLVIPNSVESIGGCAFWGSMSGVTKLIFEEDSKLSYIGQGAFLSCNDLTGDLTIPQSVCYIGNDAFNGAGCSGKLILSDNLTEITEYAFVSSDFTGNLILPYGVTSVGRSSFAGCNNISALSIPSNVASIGEYAFSCSSLSVVKCYSNSVPETSRNAFNSCPDNMIIYVPAESVDDYMSTYPWNNYNILSLEDYYDEKLVDSHVIGNGNYYGYDLPFNNWYRYSWNETIYKTGITSECIINSISYFCATPVETYATESIKIYMGETSKDNFSYENDWTSDSELTLVFSGNDVVLGGSEKETFVLDTPFNYSGKNNLVVVVAKTANNYTNILNWYYSEEIDGNAVSLFVQSDNSVNYSEYPASYYGTMSNAYANIELGIEPIVKVNESVIVDYGDYSLKYTITDVESLKCKVECVGKPTNTTSITIPSSVEILGKDFTVTSIKKYGFYLCKNITDVIIPNSIDSIEHYAFAFCDSLKSTSVYNINIPETNNSAFDNCPSDMVIYVPAASVDAYEAASPWNNYEIIGKGVVDESVFIDYESYSLKFTVTSVEPNECEVVCSNNPTTPTAIRIPSTVEIWGKEYTVTSIGNDAFHYCENLIGVEIPNSVTYIGNSAFGVSGLTSIEFPNSVTSIGTHVINSCPNIESVEIPSSLTEIGDYNFIYCPNLKSIKVDNNNPVYDSRNNCNAIIETETNTLIAGCSNTIIPNSVSSIGKAAFVGSDVINMEIPNSVISICDAAFCVCKKLENVIFEENSQLESIGDNSLPSYGVFGGCENLKSIEIPRSVTSIGDHAFDNCTSLTNIEIPNSVTFIDYYAFCHCTSLTNIEIPNSVTFIGYHAFEYCDNLTSIYCYAENVPVTRDYAFDYCPSDMVIYVPAQSLEAYKATSPWNNYTIMPMGPTNHWTVDESAYANNMSLIGLVQIDGVNQNSTSLEIGAFCGDELRGSNLIQYITALDKYLVFLTVHGNDNDEISFKLYNHSSEEVMDLRSPEAITFAVNGTLGSIETPYVLNFSNMVNITASVNPEIAGSVSGAGEYAINDIATLNAAPNYGYQFISWTENGEVVSTDAEYSFTVTEAKELVANFELLTYSVTVSANPAEGGSINGAGTYTHGETATLNAAANYGYQFISWTENGEVVSTDAEYSFTVTEAKELVANFELLTYSVTASANPAEGGSINGAGTYTHGETATLNAAANEGFSFKNWTVDGNVVSTETEYSFTVTEAKEVVANFNYVQSRNLKSGWSWFSSYIEISGANGLEMLEDALGENGLQIKSQTAFVSNSSSGWYGSLTSVSVENMYMIETSAAHEMTLIGNIVNPENHPITIGTNWRWFAYIVNQNISVEEALSTINPSHGDYVKSKTSFSQYYDGIGWIGALNTMNPGEGYMYQNTSGTTKTLVYPTSASKGTRANVTSENNYWIADAGKYSDNMSLIAFVKDNSEMDYEIGAFVGEELRGSARPIYIEALDRHMIFMTIYGKANEELTFR